MVSRHARYRFLHPRHRRWTRWSTLTKPKTLLQKISEATWHAGDPGMQYDTTVNPLAHSKNTARINASNPCSEYMFLDDPPAIWPAWNLLKFATQRTSTSKPTVRLSTSPLSAAGNPGRQRRIPDRESSARTRYDYRPLGLGYANLGALLMAAGLPYDSDAATRLRRLRHRDYVRRSLSPVLQDRRTMRATLPHHRHRQARLGSNHRRSHAGAACPGWYINREPFLDVIRMQPRQRQQHQTRTTSRHRSTTLPKACWTEALAHGEEAWATATARSPFWLPPEPSAS